MDFRSSYLSVDGELLNLTWNDTRPNGANWVKKPAPSVYEWDDAAWVMAGCFIIFGKHIMGSGMPEQGQPGGGSRPPPLQYLVDRARTYVPINPITITRIFPHCPMEHI